MNTPILFMVFNRPQTTAVVFDAIRAIRPARLYVAGDGPRSERNAEGELCRQTRKIATAVDWPCKVETLFRQNNLGCKVAVSSALSWFFENEEAGIILEDDCLPDASFFAYCEELLEKYNDSESIAHIGGCNFQNGKWRGAGSYYFSRYSHVWGWASWRRAWGRYDVQIKELPELKEKRWLEKLLPNRASREYWTKIFDSVYRDEIDTWDYQWQFAIWKTDAMAIVPNVNLISNIGFGDSSTHTSDTQSRFSRMATRNLVFPIKHPTYRDHDDLADRYTFRHAISAPLLRRLGANAKRFLLQRIPRNK